MSHESLIIATASPDLQASFLSSEIIVTACSVPSNRDVHRPAQHQAVLPQVDLAAVPVWLLPAHFHCRHDRQYCRHLSGAPPSHIMGILFQLFHETGWTLEAENGVDICMPSMGFASHGHTSTLHSCLQC